MLEFKPLLEYLTDEQTEFLFWSFISAIAGLDIGLILGEILS
jgi:hypothetical protein